MIEPTNRELREFILASFDESELTLFCFDHFEGVERHFSATMPLLDRVVELIKYCKRQGKMAELLAALAKERPSTYQAAFASLAQSGPAPEAEPQPEFDSDSFIHEKTGLTFIHIPAGEFLYGEDAQPRTLPAYWISKTAVTNLVYQKFISANPLHPVPRVFMGGIKNWHDKRRTFHPDAAEHPVVLVNWYDAITFCEWAGLQLPTEEQWEKAARGGDGRIYPWGNGKPTASLCNLDGNGASITAVGQYSPQGDSPYGCTDMVGNALEWCLNKFRDPSNIGMDRSNDERVLRGGFQGILSPTLATAVARTYFTPDHRPNAGGFRVILPQDE